MVPLGAERAPCSRHAFVFGTKCITQKSSGVVLTIRSLSETGDGSYADEADISSSQSNDRLLSFACAHSGEGSQQMQRVVLTHSLSAGGTIRQFARKSWRDFQTRVFASYDDYSHGPLPTSGRVDDFLGERQAFWKSLDLYDVDVDYEIDLKEEHISTVNSIHSAENVEIWITDSVQDIFYAAGMLHLLTLSEVDATDISIRGFSGPAVKWGLGAIRVEELESLHKSSAAERIDAKFYRDVWEVISQNSGEVIRTFVADQDPSTSVAKALSAYLLRLPEFNGGLGSIDRALLGAGTMDMKKAAYTVGSAMALGEPANDHVGDLILFKRLVELSAISPDPWFKLDGDTLHMRSCSAQITDSGQEARDKYSVQLL